MVVSFASWACLLDTVPSSFVTLQVVTQQACCIFSRFNDQQGQCNFNSTSFDFCSTDDLVFLFLCYADGHTLAVATCINLFEVVPTIL